MRKNALNILSNISVIQTNELKVPLRNPLQSEHRIAELENRLLLSAQLKTSGIEAGQRLQIIEEVSEWLDNCNENLVGTYVYIA